jgi:hypothetical protein
MPYQPFDTGWIRSTYSLLCLGWFLFSNGLLPRFTLYSFYNEIYIPYSTMVVSLCEFVGKKGISFGKRIIHYESVIFQKIDYIKPFYNIIKYIENSIPTIDGGRPPSARYLPSNVRLRKSSSGKHLACYFARKRLRRQGQIISDIQKKSNINSNHNTNENPNNIPPNSTPYAEYIFHPSNDTSCQRDEWYDAISPYWTGGMVWSGAYVLGHQVVSVCTDPIFISNLHPQNELSATIQSPEVRSEDDNVGPHATIALDSGSSIHIFKDAFLLLNIGTDNKQSINVRTTDSKFKIDRIGSLCEDLQILPLPSDGYYFYPKGVANILSLAMIAETKRVVMDTAIDNAFYVFSEDGTYI